MAADSPAPVPFFTDRHDPELAPYHAIMDQLASMPRQTLNMCVGPEVVRAGDVAMFHFVVLAAQHHPAMLDQLLFGIRLQFEHPHPNLPDELADELVWKSDPTVQRWLARVNYLLPWSVYFAQDHDVRFHMLFGDILNRERDALGIRKARTKNGNIIGIEGEQAATLFNRAIAASIDLLHFCRPAGLVPQTEIEALLAEFDIEENAGWGYERVFAEFEKQLAEGYQIRASVGPPDPQLDALAPWEGPEPGGDNDDRY